MISSRMIGAAPFGAGMICPGIGAQIGAGQIGAGMIGAGKIRHEQ
jgi:hypothetical protein